MKNWIEATPKRPCEVCGAKKWCTVTRDGGMRKCRHDLINAIKVEEDANGQYGLHPLDRSKRSYAYERQAASKAPIIALDETLHAVYSDLLGRLTLSDAHRDNLRQRGFLDPWIDMLGYKSFGAGSRTAMLAEMREKHGDKLLEVPGFWCADDGKVYLSGAPGIAIPVRLPDGRVVGIRIRRDVVEDGDGKYRWLSSAQHGGPSSGMRVHCPMVPSSEEFRVTEGELKADLVSLATGCRTISMPGATCTQIAMEALRKLDAKRVRLALDADKHEARSGGQPNAVCNALQILTGELHAANKEVIIEHWADDAGKGIDDVIAAGKLEAIEEHRGEAVWPLLAKVCADAKTPMREYVLRMFQRTLPASPAETNDPLDDETANVEVPWRPKILIGDETELANLLVERLRRRFGGVPVVYDREQFWRYDQSVGIWRHLSDAWMLEEVSQASGTAWRKKGKIETFEMSAGKCKGTLRLAQAIIQRQQGDIAFFDTAPMGVHFKNGFLRLDAKTGELALWQRAPENRQTFVLDIDYAPDAPQDAWLSFLQEIFSTQTVEDQQLCAHLLEEFVGASLFGFITRYEKMLVLLGDGSNGKTTLLDTIKELFPKDAVASLPVNEWDDKFHVVELIGKRINLVNELPARDIMDGKALKTIVSGNEVGWGRRLRENLITFLPIAGHLVSANKMPKSSDDSHGFRRRLAIIPFCRKFTEAEKDVNFRDKLLASLPGIAAAVVAGAVRLLRRGRLIEPSSTQEAMLEWTMDTDQIARFLAEVATNTVDMTTKGVARPPSEETISGAEIHEVYTLWAKKTNHGGMSSSTFLAKLKRFRVKYNTHTAYAIMLNDDAVARLRAGRTSTLN